MGRPMTDYHPELASRTLVRGLWRLARPQQWIKNLLVFAALLFTESFLRAAAWPPVLLAFAGFCLLSSAVYVANDWHDEAEDRLHPHKRDRPLASGAVTHGAAAWLFALFVVLGLVLNTLAGLWVLITGVSFLAVNVLYTYSLKSHVLVDAFGISAGFLLRAAAGAAALSVSVSPWLFVLVLLLTLFLALGKRRSELRTLRSSPDQHRQVLGRYTPALLDQLLAATVSSIIALYAVYSFNQPLHAHSFMLTIPFVIYGLFRYLYLLSTSESLENPDEILVSDKATLLDLGLWGVAVVALLVLKHGGVL